MCSAEEGMQKIDLGEFFVFNDFFCFDAKHTESSESALPFGFTEPLRLPFCW